MSTKSKTKPSDAEIIPATFARLMEEKGSVSAALDALHRNLTALRSRYDAAKGEWIVEDDGPTQVASAKALLSWGIGEPVKRQQILSGKIPDAPLNREQLRDAIDRRIAAKLEQPDLSATELLSLKKALVEVEASEPLTPLTEEQAVAAARRIHGMYPEAPLVPPPESKP